ncbi:hypothetical protein RFI_36352, partial [Reticulomyxa filosa]
KKKKKKKKKKKSVREGIGHYLNFYRECVIALPQVLLRQHGQTDPETEPETGNGSNDESSLEDTIMDMLLHTHSLKAMLQSLLELLQLLSASCGEHTANVDVLETLYQAVQLSHSNSYAYALYLFLFKCAIKPVLDTISAWIFRGEFVDKKEELSTCGGKDAKATFNKLPDFLKRYQPSIDRCGWSLRILLGEDDARMQTPRLWWQSAVHELMMTSTATLRIG